MTGVGQAETLPFLRQADRFQQSGDFAAALRCLDEVIAADPGNAEAYCARGNALADLGRTELALANYDRAIVLDPAAPDPHDFRGIVLAQSGRMDEALLSFDRAIALGPGNVNALNNRANVLKSLNRLDEALAAQEQVVSALPDFAPGYNNRGNTLIALGRLDEAIDSFDRALELDPGQLQSHCNRANALVKLARVEEAIQAYREALSLDSRQVDVLLNLAELLSNFAQPEEAADCYQQALALDPDNLDAWLGSGDVLLALYRPDKAFSCFKRVLELDANNAEAMSHMGIACMQLHLPEKALACFDQSVAHNPNDPQTWQSRGNLLLELGEVEGALASQDRTLAIAPLFPYELGRRFHTAMRLSHWNELDRYAAVIRQSIEEGGRLIAPFDLVTTVDDPGLQKRCAELFVQHELPHVRERPIGSKYRPRQRIRIGYFSADFREHATMQLLLETLEAHDRDHFEFTAISFGPDIRDLSRQRAERAMDRFVDVQRQADSEIVRLSRELELDIAIDLKGYTQGNRTGVFVERVAPIQASYLGFPGTTGIPAMDYVISDKIVIPAGHEGEYSEYIVRLPGSYQPNRRIGKISAVANRVDAGLAHGAFVYCCFNQSYKITPDLFDVWMRILSNVPNSVLWLWVNQASARSNLHRAAAERGIAADRLVFAERLPGEQHLDRLRLADLFLDTLPCNAHTTASDALRVGLPLLTCTGKSFASRVAASLLDAMDLPELVTTNLADYEARAVALGTDAGQFARIKEKLLRNRATTSLFDPARMARSLETAYLAMYERYQNDLPPADITL